LRSLISEIERAVASDPLDAASVPERVGSADSCSDSTDNDGDGQTDGSDPGCADADGDTMPDESDPCPTRAESAWNDADADGLGDACDPDSDNDTVTDADEANLGSDPLDATSTPETRAIDGICQDAIDNDRDGLTDDDDPRCLLPSKLGLPAIRPGFDSVPLAANDDDSTGPIGLGFEIGFGGHTYSSAYVNNNGNLTFDTPLEDFVPFDLTLAPDPIVAPFFGDVDTRDGAVARATRPSRCWATAVSPAPTPGPSTGLRDRAPWQPGATASLPLRRTPRATAPCGAAHSSASSVRSRPPGAAGLR
jgi:hypothetical protein